MFTQWLRKSYNWFIWQFNPENKKVIGELTQEYKELPMSGIYPTKAITVWIDICFGNIFSTSSISDKFIRYIKCNYVFILFV
jgi:hypothetical protein